MLKVITYVIVLACAGVCFAHDENVVIKQLNEQYTLALSPTGTIDRVRKSKSITYLATRADDKAYALEHYDDFMKIKKASAPGAKPIYVANEYGDMFYTGQRICALPIPLTKGKEATARFEVTYEDPAQFCSIFLAESKPVEAATYSLTVPKCLASVVNVTPFNLPEGATLDRREVSNGDIVYSVAMQNRPPYRDEPHSPEVESFVPRLVITGLFDDYHALYRYLHKRVEPEDPNDEIINLTNSVTYGCPDNAIDKANAIADWVRQNIRYIAIEHGEFGTRPDLAANVLAKRFGDCKGSANLTRMMLRAAGIDGRLAWAGTRGNVVGSFEEFPVLGAGNHLIACAVLADSIIYLDGTTKFCPAGYVPRSIAGTQVMIEDGDDCLLRTIPAHDDMADRIEVAGEYTLSDKELIGSLSFKLSGSERLIFENTNASLNASRRDGLYQKYLSPTKTARFDNIVIAEAPTNAQHTSISLNESDRGAVIASSAKTHVMLRPFRLLRIDPVDLSERHSPLHYASQQHIVTNMTFRVPEGWQTAKLPEPATIDNEWFEGTLEYTLADNNVHVRGFLRCKNNEAPLARIGEFNDCLRQLDRLNTASISLVKQ